MDRRWDRRMPKALPRDLDGNPTNRVARVTGQTSGLELQTEQQIIQGQTNKLVCPQVTPVVFIPALAQMCDEQPYRDVIAALGAASSRSCCRR